MTQKQKKKNLLNEPVEPRVRKIQQVVGNLPENNIITYCLTELITSIRTQRILRNVRCLVENN